jgi:hypothetical protein
MIKVFFMKQFSFMNKVYIYFLKNLTRVEPSCVTEPGCTPVYFTDPTFRSFLLCSEKIFLKIETLLEKLERPFFWSCWRRLFFHPLYFFKKKSLNTNLWNICLHKSVNRVAYVHNPLAHSRFHNAAKLDR